MPKFHTTLWDYTMKHTHFPCGEFFQEICRLVGFTKHETGSNFKICPGILCGDQRLISAEVFRISVKHLAKINISVNNRILSFNNSVIFGAERLGLMRYIEINFHLPRPPSLTFLENEDGGGEKRGRKIWHWHLSNADTCQSIKLSKIGLNNIYIYLNPR